MLTLLTAITFAAEPPVVGVADLRNATGDPAYDAVSASLSELLHARLLATEGLQVVPRQAVRDVSSELRFGPGGDADPRSAALVGELVGARWLVTGTVTSPGAPELALSLRATHVGSGIVEYAGVFTAPIFGPTDLVSLVEDAASETIVGLDLTVTDRTRAAWVADRARAESALDRLGLRFAAADLNHPEALFRDSATDQLAARHRQFWTVHDNRGNVVAMPAFSRTVGDEAGADAWSRAIQQNFARRRATRWTTLGLMCGGVALAAAGGASGLTERAPGAVGAGVMTLELGGIVFFVTSEIRHLARRNVYSYPSTFYTPAEADAWITRHNATLR